MKTILNVLVLLVFHQIAFSQTSDTIPEVTVDTVDVPTEELNVMADTLHIIDSVKTKTISGKDTTIARKKIHSPRGATLRSAIVPGWGQVYNGKYWKVPLVYAAIGTPVVLFFNNKSWYDRTRYALSVVANDHAVDPAYLSKVHPQLFSLVEGEYETALVNYRNEFRRDMDYSLLFVLLMWGLNVVDATVDGHLKGFDVSDDLSLRFKPSMFTNTMGPGISLVLHFK